jgi:pimeloyl-ACP methyl ester carboxylesterase
MRRRCTHAAPPRLPADRLVASPDAVPLLGAHAVGVVARLLVLLSAGALAGAAPAAPGRLQLHPCVVQDIRARCATLSVPEDRAEPRGPQIGLRVVVVPAATPPIAPDAFTYVAGGPGGASTDAVPAAFTFWREVHEHHDMVFVDQRGTGGSHDLECPDPNRQLTPAQARAYVRTCLATLRADPANYGTRVAMDDLEAVRSALGYESFDVYGTSYGATAAQVFLAAHPRSVRAVVLDGGTLLGIPFFSRFASNGERALDALAVRCHAVQPCRKAFPHWREQLDALIARWNEHPVTVSGAIRLTGDGLAGVVQSLTLTDEGAAVVPSLVTRLARGDLGALRDHVGGEPTRQVMFWAVWCNEPWVGLDAKGPWHSYLDGYTVADLASYNAACALVPKHAEPAALWRAPHSNVPLLALVGGADPQDPIGNLNGLSRAFPTSRAVVVHGLGHAIGQYGCLGDLVARFIARRDPRSLDTSCVRGIATAPFLLDT